ncbi:NUDIX hydrolase [Gordonia sp. DT219]|uniref:NUDIX hydrolase n=1 Tax=Gordonia sp. DT219 TaxID=3416658 RepID=UPI003CF04A63
MPSPSPASGSDAASTSSVRVEVLTAVFRVRGIGAGAPELCVLLAPDEGGRWCLPGGDVVPGETLETSARQIVAGRLDLGELAHLEQLAVFSAPDRVPALRTIASTYVGLVPSDARNTVPDRGDWHPVDALPALAFDHGEVITKARLRLAAKLSYTNIAFALAPARFPMSELSEIYGAALGYRVDTTNLLRILSRRGVVMATGTLGRTGRSGGRPPALYAFADKEIRVTDEFATLRPPM